jgi:Flp pilus assembly protein TadG
MLAKLISCFVRMRAPRGRRQRRRIAGATIVEFALVFIFFMTILFGIVGFGHALYAYHFVDHAAKEATRYAVVRGSTCLNDADGGSCQASNSATGTAGPTSQPDILTFVQSIAPTGIAPSQLSVTVCGVGAGSSGTPPVAIPAVACADSTATACATTPNQPGCTVKVQVNYTFHFIVPLITLSSLPLSSSSEMVIAH